MTLRDESDREVNKIIANSNFSKECLTLEAMERLAERLRAGNDPDIQGRFWVFKHENGPVKETFFGGGKD
ncbi:MAG: hypothetical protein QOH47_1074 [Sphingomonadales bacterium]|jgi:hypothetical protein|nr:hypothetical protein [Sphingomonadales bacterium]